MKIKVKFCDWYNGFVPETHLLYRLLCRHYTVELSDSPDYVIYSNDGYEYTRYPNAIRIFFTGENLVPDFNEADYGIGFERMTFGDRYFRLPLFATYDAYERNFRSEVPDRATLLNRKFCSFVISNGNNRAPIVKKFIEELSKYRPLASGGRWMNNVGGPVADKMSFISQYKFNIAFENTSSPGYITEKIMEPFAAYTVPIYWGDPFVADEFDTGAMVLLRSEDDIGAAIEQIKCLDNDDEAYLEKVLHPCLSRPQDHYEKELEQFLRRIFDQPIGSARRLHSTGFQGHFRLSRFHMYQHIERLRNIRARVKQFLPF